MRSFVIATLLLPLLSACATAIPYSPKEKCAFDDMKLVGMSHGDGVASGVSYGYQQPMRFSNTNLQSTSVQCEIPKTPEEQQEIARVKASLAPKVEYNSGINTMEFITGLGYFIYIIPGVIAKIAFDGQAAEAIRQSDAIYKGTSTAPVTQVQPQQAPQQEQPVRQSSGL